MIMERREFCKGAKCAKLIVVVEGKAPLTFVSNAPSLIVEASPIEEERYTHVMTAPMDGVGFPFVIKDVQFLSGFWFCNDFSSEGGKIKLDCPMPGTFPYVDQAGGIELVKGRDTSDLYWRENQLFCYFEPIERRRWSSYYPNNRGSCTYKILGGGDYKFFDRQGILYKSEPGQKLTYEIKCDDCCGEDRILCDHHHYPGYKCYPIPPTASRLLKGQHEIKRYWRHHK